ncbi:uncharacterized protein METZ01_LOCUS133936, partial [marine metagenome]
MVLIIIIGCEKESSSNPKGLKTENLILITLDGVRWQEVFQGADNRIIMNNVKDEKIREETLKAYWFEDEKERRKNL